MQGVLVFASAAARNADITSPQEGQFAFTKDTNGLWYYDGAAWVASGATGDIEGVTAGVGITGGGTRGTVTITNDMATTITASGDIVVGTGSGTYDNLPIGTTAQVLTADTTVSPYKVKWATPSTGSPWNFVATGSIPSGTNAISLTSLPSYDTYWIMFRQLTNTQANTNFNFTMNNLGSSIYDYGLVATNSSVQANESSGGFASSSVWFRNGATALAYGYASLVITNCKNTSYGKTWLMNGVDYTDARVVNANGFINSLAVLSRLDFTTASGNFAGGGSYYVWGQ
jgi:hypothetical protein